MINSNQVEIARNNWLKASEELNFNIMTPFEVLVENIKNEVFAYLPDYGSRNGAIVELFNSSDVKTDRTLSDWAKENKVFISFCNIDSFLEYNISYFREVLKDWKIV